MRPCGAKLNRSASDYRYSLQQTDGQYTGWIPKRQKLRYPIVLTFSVHRVALGVYDDDEIEMTSLALQPCETPRAVLDRRNDLNRVVSVMKLDEALSIAQVAQRLIDNKLVDCKTRRGAEMRVSKAVPTRVGHQCSNSDGCARSGWSLRRSTARHLRFRAAAPNRSSREQDLAYEDHEDPYKETYLVFVATTAT